VEGVPRIRNRTDAEQGGMTEPPRPANSGRTPLVVILGDQLSLALAALKSTSPDQAVVLMVEVAEETGYVWHHVKKLAFVLSAMRHFANRLREQGWRVDYVRLDDPDNTGTFTGEIDRALDRHGLGRVVVTSPGEWRVLASLKDWAATREVALEILDDSRFLCPTAEFARWAEGRRQLRMETFYHFMRERTGLLMDGTEPAGGRWNFDHDNRKPADPGLDLPDVPRFEPDSITNEVLDLVGQRFKDHPGELRPFWFAVTADDADAALRHFMRVALPRFGDYQDAMLAGRKFLFHSVLSPYLNCGLLDPLEVCRAAEAEYRSGRAPLNAVEGFIRQILGWREYVRGVYWLRMPDYARSNALAAKRPLPAFYWTGKTDMACLAACIGQTLEDAYAHHIQRLMVTGNFALLAGIDPHAVHEWYLAVYVDAFEWVELPNTIGMSQFADGGLLASKPYAASGNYINRMSDYCGKCRFDVKQKTGPRACPFNYLYWDFLARNAAVLGRNHRLAQPYATLARFDAGHRDAITSSAATFLATLE
jgi:deoxyribodipyrimidine photolyase-related protein